MNTNLCVKCKKIPSEENKKCCRECLNKHNEFQKKYRNKNISEGLCVYCCKPSNSKQCKECSEKRSKHHRDKRKTRKDNGICVECNLPALPGITRCDKHNKIMIAATLNRYNELDAKKLCVRCGHNRTKNTKHCEKCLLKIISYKLWKTKNREKELLALLEKQNYTCPYSGKKLIIGDNASIDHINPTSKGGSSDMTNLQWVDFYVNSMKSDKYEKEFLEMVVTIAKCRNLI